MCLQRTNRCTIIHTTSLTNIKNISENLGWTTSEVLEVVDSLTGKDLLKIDVKKNQDSLEEYLNVDNFYEKLSFQLIGKKEEKKETTTLFESFEKEFGRGLSPIEYEIIKGWMENDFSE